jgi:hypothetical protein
MATSDQKHFYLKLWGWKIRRGIHDCKQAYLLYSWYIEHVVWEYIRGDGRRYGRVAWRDQITDRGCATAISAEGTPCSERSVRRWRTDLKRFGYITWRTARNSLIIFVLGSDKFPKGHERVKDAPVSDEALISAAFALRDKLANDSMDAQTGAGMMALGVSKAGYSDAQNCDISTVNMQPRVANLGHPTGQPWTPYRPTLDVAIREEALSEFVSEEPQAEDEPFAQTFRKGPERTKRVAEQKARADRWTVEGRCRHCGADNPKPAMTSGMAYCGKCDGLYPLPQPSQRSGGGESDERAA